MSKQIYFTELIDILKNKKLTKEQLVKLKVRLCSKHNIDNIPTDIEILLNASIKDLPKLRYLQTKPTRTISGVAVVALMTKPIKCRHGKCIYCPGGPNSFFGYVPQSYTGKEPATMRGLRNKFDSYLQVFNRLEQYTLLGHGFDKTELIIMGGTFPSFPKKYRDSFIKYALKALNDFSVMFFKDNGRDVKNFKEFFYLPGEVNDKERVKKIQKNLLKIKGKCNLEKEQKRNENSRIRCIALCIETRPDYSKKRHINEMLMLGTTRVELGIQTIYNNVLKKIERGHTVEDTIKATQLLKDSFLKVGYHIMPGLPGVTQKMDLEAFKELFLNQNFMPDALKIYPTMVLKGTKLYKLWKRKRYKPLTTRQAAGLIARFKKHVPEWCRILRVQRDIPSYLAEGVDRTNLRQYVHKLLEKNKIKCRCIRCREPRKRKIDFSYVKIKRQSYEASNGTEIFLSAKDIKNDILLGFCRLRLPYKPFRKEITGKSMGIRELHVYGPLAEIGKKGSIQHMGLGKRLLKKAERIAKEEFDARKMLIISGIGARLYYKKFGYRKEGCYMVKLLKN